MNQQIIHNRPPNFRKILDAFPGAAGPTVMFSYGDKLYVPDGGKVPPALIDHEAVHGERQMAQGVEAWWDQYIADPQFRFYEELLAHRAEYRWHEQNQNRGQRRRMLKLIAMRLSGRLYGKLCTLSHAKALIQAQDEEFQIWIDEAAAIPEEAISDTGS